ncbi:MULTISPECIES: hypothetical protein [Sphingobium]|uniref:Integral membrane protein Cj1412c n=2 Tax=Sphingobium fuliginis (strain ATCC 27551) TaxID=336203 RepID=A0A5B8CJG8_SPHSA|nr:MULTISPECIES: hypothetical protein [Sphingobium]PNP96176.1 hypothetical protein A8G00_23425 [Sphingobium sp. SA916]QDC38270.1 hypothetical protein FIL70_14600 [Sphingobium fuliginis ATCC 27551]GAY20196.1 probable integral membrane protein Cj1412c [Sphingobium fuliginis]
MEKFKRKVFYLGGFDPRGVRFYHQMYREQAEAYTRLSGERVEVSARRSGPASSASWTVTNHGAGVETDYEFLRWEDLVGKVWIRNPLLLAWRSIATYGAHARHMQFLRMRKLRPGPVITILYPPLLAVLIPLALALIPALPLSLLMPFWAAALIGIAVSVALSGRLLNKLIVPWLLRFMVYNHSVAAQGPGTDMDERLDQFAARIVGEVDGPWDEVVFASHSNGTIYAMSVLRRILELRGDRPLPDNFTVLTLGQVVPVIALRKDARWYHADLKALDDKPFRLVDFSAPPDGAAYHGVHPIRLVSDRCAARVDLLSPRFHLFYDPENYHGGWSNKYEAHFDYLRVGDRLSPVDYVSLTAGRRTIDEAIAQFRTIP